MQELTQWLTEDSFTRREELSFVHCDQQKRIRPATLLCLAAAMAGHDYDARGLPYEKLFALREVFLLSRISLKLHHYPLSGEILTITTWEDGAKGAYVQRGFEFCNSNASPGARMRDDLLLVSHDDS